MRLVGYVRVSRVAGREGESFISPGVQRERLARYAEAGGHSIVSWQEDLDQPGSRYERPGFQAALEAVERGEADGIIVASLDRFARSVPDAAVALRRLEQAGGTLVSVRDALDTSTPIGRFARTMMLALAELELDRIRENWQVARERAIARGVHFSPRTPLGYRRREDGRLEPDPVSGPVVRELFLRRAAGASWTELADWLDGRLPRGSGGRWTRQTVLSIVSRRSYLGEAYQGDTINPRAHEPLVTRAEWEAAQTSRWQHGPSGRGRLLSGIIRCAGCGYPLSPNSGGRRGYAYYQCRGRHAAGACPAPAKISVLRADGHVVSRFKEWLSERRIVAKPERRDDVLEDAVRRVEAAERELADYRDTNLVSVIGREAWVAGMLERQRAVDEARDELAERTRGGSDVDLDPVGILDAWDTLGLPEQRALLASAIDAVVARRAGRPGKGSPADWRLVILWRGQAPRDLPGRRNPVMRPLIVAEETPDQVGSAGAHDRQERLADRSRRRRGHGQPTTSTVRKGPTTGGAPSGGSPSGSTSAAAKRTEEPSSR